MKILLIGNETRNTDIQATILSKELKAVKNGLISTLAPDVLNDGIYHTSVVDLHPGEIVRISHCFDLVKLLDQDIKTYPHYKTFVTTARLFCDLDENHIPVEYKENKNNKNFLKDISIFNVKKIPNVTYDTIIYIETLYLIIITIKKKKRMIIIKINYMKVL